METPRTYKLERWIAFLLALLFFLPFVANADELAYTDTFRASEVRHRTGEQFLALVGSRLEPVTIRVTAARDPFEDAEGETTGKRIEAGSYEDAFLLRSGRLKAGPVTLASPHSTENALDTPLTITLGRTHATLDYRCGDAPDPDGIVSCALVLESAGTTQVLAEVFAFFEARHDLQVYYAFAGDLDRDGKLDLLIDISVDEHEWHPALFLSSAAREGELVAKVAEIVSAGC